MAHACRDHSVLSRVGGGECVVRGRGLSDRGRALAGRCHARVVTRGPLLQRHGEVFHRCHSRRYEHRFRRVPTLLGERDSSQHSGRDRRLQRGLRHAPGTRRCQESC
eukprot:Lithocolla_globosa_v1_NODE_1380_length_2620_cov_17.193762.p2 type:complete len:107 gc:universal NODE_1380_length_2620_cov_17.193762:1270-950(-)